jgi:hypothetical protein
MGNVNWKNPYENKGDSWLKGNLHTHTEGSPLKDMVKEYERRGFVFLAITDHGAICDYTGLDTKLKMIYGMEIDIIHQSHMCVLGLNRDKIFYKKDFSIQNLIDNNKKEDNLCILNHPDWELKEHYCFDELNTYEKYDGIEIYNKLIEDLDGSPLSTAKWDRLLAHGKKVLGFVNHDAHRVNDVSDCGNMASVSKADPVTIFEALKTGCFYGYHGVEIIDIGRKKDTLYVNTKNAELIRFIGFGGKHLKKVKGKEAEINFENVKSHVYIRIECLGIGEEISWSQPFFRE